MPTACYHPVTGALLGVYRPAHAIFAALSALTGPQKTAVWADLTGGSPAKWTSDRGPNAAAILMCVGITVSLAGAMTAAQLTDMKVRAVAAYVLDNPLYLVNPAFDPTINVPGWE